MRLPFSERVERGRIAHPLVRSTRGDDWGFFHIKTNDGVELRIMVSPGRDEVPWEHVSVSTRTRVPTWAEMCWVKDLFFDEEEVVIQFHPKKSEYVNFNDRTLHLWRPTTCEIPTPPPIAVGPRTQKELEETLAAVGYKIKESP